jgi:hypothetical protein
MNQMVTVSVQKRPGLNIFECLLLRLPLSERPQLVEREVDIP